MGPMCVLTGTVRFAHLTAGFPLCFSDFDFHVDIEKVKMLVTILSPSLI